MGCKPIALPLRWFESNPAHWLAPRGEPFRFRVRLSRSGHRGPVACRRRIVIADPAPTRVNETNSSGSAELPVRGRPFAVPATDVGVVTAAAATVDEAPVDAVVP
jgi:hypothetical protein